MGLLYLKVAIINPFDKIEFDIKRNVKIKIPGIEVRFKLHNINDAVIERNCKYEI